MGALPPPDQDDAQSVSSLGSASSQRAGQSNTSLSQDRRQSIISQVPARRDPTPSTTNQTSFRNPTDVAAQEKPREQRRMRGSTARTANELSSNWMPRTKGFYKGASSNHDHYWAISHDKAREQVDYTAIQAFDKAVLQEDTKTNHGWWDCMRKVGNMIHVLGHAMGMEHAHKCADHDRYDLSFLFHCCSTGVGEENEFVEASSV